MLIIDTESTRDTKKNEERRRFRFDRFVNEAEKKKKIFRFSMKENEIFEF